MSNAQLHERLAAEMTLEFGTFGDLRERWETLVERSPAAGLYHGERWIELLRRAYGFNFSLVLLCANGEPMAGCVAAYSQNPFARRLVAMPFSDHCAPLDLGDQAGDELLATLALDGRVQACEIRGCAAPWPWQVVNCFQNWELRPETSPAQLYRRLATNFRRNIARATQQGVAVERGHDVSMLSRFYRMQCESRRRQGLPAQPWSFFRHVRELFASSGDFEIWIASRHHADLAAVVTLRERDRVYYKWGARATVEASGAGHLLLWNIVEEICGRKAQALELGRTDLRNTGLNRFKREAGAVASPLPYAYIPRAPRSVSAEILSGWRAAASSVWSRMPASMCRMIGGFAYRYLS